MTLALETYEVVATADLVAVVEGSAPTTSASASTRRTPSPGSNTRPTS
ncbi:hypothetical protein Q9Q99_20260 [Curtobacterium flaccumfaciens]|nr:hypothetical protein Q9Q99_20260 [Curtobacterium flaccumfaciens]